MNYKYLDMESYARRSHFAYFNSLSYPYAGVTVNVDITGFLAAVRKKRLPFFLTFCYCVSRAANSIPQLRQRILKDQIIEFETCRTSHTVALEDETYCYCTLDSSMPFSDYLPYAIKAQEQAKAHKGIEEDSADTLDKFFISTLPWLSYSSLVQPVPMPADSNPRITWGKYFEQNGTVLVPVTILCHHALVDGIHLSKFYSHLQEQLTQIC